MKNVLFATTALVAFAGAAAADGNVGVTGSASFGVNSIDGFSWGLGLDLAAEVDMGMGITAGMTTSVALDGGDGTVGIDALPVIYIQNDMAKLSFGAVDLAGDHVATTSGMDFGMTTYDDLSDWATAPSIVVAPQTNPGFDQASIWAVRGDVTFGAFNVSVSGVEDFWNGTQNLAYLMIGGSATLGSFDIAAAYQVDDNIIGASVGTSFGAVSVVASYISGGWSLDGDTLVWTTGDSIGIEGEYTSGAMSVGAYYATNTPGNQEYGVTGSYTTGPLTAGASWDGDSAGGSNFNVTADYTVNDYIAVGGAWDQADGIDVFGTYTFESGSFLLYYSQAGGVNDTGYGAEVSIDF